MDKEKGTEIYLKQEDAEGAFEDLIYRWDLYIHDRGSLEAVRKALNAFNYHLSKVEFSSRKGE